MLPITVLADPVAPTITSDLSTTPVTCFQNAYLNKLSVSAKSNDGGTLSYQWYNGLSASNVTSAISGAQSSRYKPTTQKTGTTYYQVIVTDTLNGHTAVTASSVVCVTVNPLDLRVHITTTDGQAVPADGYQYHIGDTAATLQATATASAPDADVSGGTWRYEWFTQSSNGDLNFAPGTNNKAAYTPQTDTDSSVQYVCYAYFSLNGVMYNEVAGNPVPVKVVATSAQIPVFSTQPVGSKYLLNSSYVKPMNVSVSVSDGGTLSYQWFVSTDNNTFFPINGANENSYTPPISVTEAAHFYHCVVTNALTSISGHTYTSTGTSAAAAITFTTVAGAGGNWAGSGTADSPYLIATQNDLALLQNLVNTQGFSFEGYFFKLTNDITLPSGWVPIGELQPGQIGAGNGRQIRPFSGTLDGDGHTLTVPDGGLPLLGYVRFTTVKNLNIYGSHIAGYGLVNNYCVDYGPTGDYGDWTATANYPNMPLSVRIDHVTLKSGSRTLMAGFIGGYASGADTIDIRNSTIENNVIIGYNKDQSSIGSFAGAFNGSISNCVSSATVYGVSQVGGLVGTKGQSMGNCTIQGSAFSGSVAATGTYVGGIAGSGYSGGGSAPNTPCVSIQNCYVTGSVTGSDDVGGLFGGEPGCKQNWVNGIGYIQNNYFSGSVAAATAGTVNVGGIIGSMKSLDRYNIISNNYYLDSCGASRGIGMVNSVDTATTTHYNRADDPTGKDADQLSKSVNAGQFADGMVSTALNSGINSSGNWIQKGKLPGFGTALHLDTLTLTGYKTLLPGGSILDPRTLTAVAMYSDGTTKPIDIGKVSITGFNSDLIGYYTVTATYENHTYIFEIQISTNADYSGDLAAAKTAVSGATYVFPMSAANTSDEIRTLVQNEINALSLNGVTATVTMGNFTPAAAKTSFNKPGTSGSFTFSVELSKGRGAANVNGSVSLTGTVTPTMSATTDTVNPDVPKPAPGFAPAGTETGTTAENQNTGLTIMNENAGTGGNAVTGIAVGDGNETGNPSGSGKKDNAGDGGFAIVAKAPNTNIHKSLNKALPCILIAAAVVIPAVMAALAVWKKRHKNTAM